MSSKTAGEGGNPQSSPQIPEASEEIDEEGQKDRERASESTEAR
jgi:hypothetical protein